LLKTDKEARYVALRELIDKCSSVFTLLFLGGYLVREFENHEKDPTKDEPLISDKKQIEDLKHDMEKKVEEYSKKPEFKHHHSLGPLLIWWESLSTEPEKVKKFAVSLLSKKSDSFLLLKAFRNYVTSQTLGEYVSTRSARIDTGSLDKLVGLYRVKAAVLKFSKGKLSEEEKELIETFNNSINKKDDF
jgi:hypothetical protein